MWSGRTRVNKTLVGRWCYKRVWYACDVTYMHLKGGYLNLKWWNDNALYSSHERVFVDDLLVQYLFNFLRELWNIELPWPLKVDRYVNYMYLISTYERFLLQYLMPQFFHFLLCNLCWLRSNSLLFGLFSFQFLYATNERLGLNFMCCQRRMSMLYEAKQAHCGVKNTDKTKEQ